jgi:predicted RNase H-like HicB family nuclease
MARDGRAPGRPLPDRVSTAFAYRLAPVGAKVAFEVATLHRSAQGCLRAEYAEHMATPVRLTAIYEPVEDGWVQARVKELPGVITAAPSLDEAKAMLEDALREYLLAQMQDGEGAEAGAGQQGAIEVTITA